jgi:hypothetical protein
LALELKIMAAEGAVILKYGQEQITSLTQLKAMQSESWRYWLIGRARARSGRGTPRNFSVRYNWAPASSTYLT